MLWLVLLVLLPGWCFGRGFESVSLVSEATAGSRLFLTDFYIGAPPPESCLAAKPDWGLLEVYPFEVGRSVHYYQQNLDWIHETGLDGVILHLNGQPLPSPLRTALEKSDVKATASIADPFLTVQAAGDPYVWSRNAALKLSIDAIAFLNALSTEQTVHDADGRTVLFVEGGGRELDALAEPLQDLFFVELIERIEWQIEGPVRLYWTAPCGTAILRAVAKFGEVRTINANLHDVRYPMSDAIGVNLFFLDSPCSEIGDVRRVRYGIGRLEQALWLTEQAQCRLVRFAGWNSFTDGTNISPDRTWGDKKMEIARVFIEEARREVRFDCPPTMLIARREPRTTLPSERRLALLGRRYPFADVTVAGEDGIQLPKGYQRVLVDDPAADSGDIEAASVALLFVEAPVTENSVKSFSGIFTPLKHGEQQGDVQEFPPRARLPLPFDYQTSAAPSRIWEASGTQERILLANPRNVDLDVEVPADRAYRVRQEHEDWRETKAGSGIAVRVPPYAVLDVHPH